MLTSPADSIDVAGREAVANVLDFLVTAQRERLDLDAAQRGFRLVCDRHRDVEMELLWEEERYAATMHYDVLLRLSGGGTVSLGFAAAGSVPWLVRTAHHSRDSDVARVNSQTLDIQTVVSYLDLLWGDTRLMEQLVDEMLIDEAIQRHDIQVSPAEAQRAMDELRASLGLYRAADTVHWMQRHGMTQERLGLLASRDAATAALRERVIDDDAVSRYLGAHAMSLDTLHAARFRMADPIEARNAVSAIKAGQADFFAMAQQQFLASGSGRRRRGGDVFITATRRSLSAEQAELLFGAQPGDVVGPVASGDGHDVVRILAFAQARSDDPASRTAARLALFDDWLAERRERASIEWFWGHAGSS